VLLYDSYDDESDVGENDAGESTVASQMSSASITSCSLGAAIVTEAQSRGATQSFTDTVTECRPPVVTECRHAVSAATQDSPTVLTRQQVCCKTISEFESLQNHRKLSISTRHILKKLVQLSCIKFLCQFMQILLILLQTCTG